MRIETVNEAIEVLAREQIAGVERAGRIAAHAWTLQAAVLALIDTLPDKPAFRRAFSAHYEKAYELNSASNPGAVAHMETFAQQIHAQALLR